MKKIRLELVAPVPRSTFIEIYDGDDFRNFVMQNHPHIGSVEILEKREDENVRYVRSRTTMKIDLPGFLSVLKNVVKPHNEEEQTFYKKEHRVEFRSHSSISKSYGRVSYLADSPTETRRVVELELEAIHIPGFLRHRAEEFFADKAREQIQFYQQIINRYFAERKAV